MDATASHRSFLAWLFCTATLLSCGKSETEAKAPREEGFLAPPPELTAAPATETDADLEQTGASEPSEDPARGTDPRAGTSRRERGRFTGGKAALHGPRRRVRAGWGAPAPLRSGLRIALGPQRPGA